LSHDTLRAVQRRLEHFYALEGAPDIALFVRTGEPEHRETLLVRQTEDEVEVALVLPPLGDLPPLEELDAHADDRWLQVVEGISHFVYVAERARINLPATRLELELQAEVDKFVLLTLSRGRLDRREVRRLHGHLYERVRFLHPAGSEDGDRYRLANELAARFVARCFDRGDPWSAVDTLRRFYRSGQTDKIHLARAA
jgi:hypothetical protein